MYYITILKILKHAFKMFGILKIHYPKIIIINIDVQNRLIIKHILV